MLKSNIEGFPVKRGKVRDIYELGPSKLIIVTTDRISAFDYVLPNAIKDKGRVLTQLSIFWSDVLSVYDHFITTDPMQMPEAFRTPELAGRTMLVERAKVVPFECVVRGYLCGSAWKEYQKNRTICGIKLPFGLKENQQFPKPIFTPATKVENGHDENVSFRYMTKEIGIDLAEELEFKSIEIYSNAAEIAWEKGIIIADTKFEWGLTNNKIILIDEILTPDSSRFWALDQYRLGESMPSYDKQFVRDWLETSGWDKNSQPPVLPNNVVEETRSKYIEAYTKLTGMEWRFGD